MRKLQGERVLVPQGELKLIIYDNLSARESSNMGIKLWKLQKEIRKESDESRVEGNSERGSGGFYFSRGGKRNSWLPENISFILVGCFGA